MKDNTLSFLNGPFLFQAVLDAFKMLRPSVQIKNPIMFITYIGAVITTFYIFFDSHFTFFNVQIALWLWFTVLFANFAQAVAEGRGKAHAESLRKTKVETYATLITDGIETRVPSSHLKKGDIIICEAGVLIPVDGEVIEGVATVDESPITGESAPVIRESGGDRTAVTAGTKVLSDRIKIRVTSEVGHSFLDRIIGLIEGAQRQKTPNEIALHVVLSGLTIIFLLATASLKSFAIYSSHASHQSATEFVTVPVLIALLVCLIPTTVSALISAIGIAGMDRLIRKNVIAKSGRSVEAAGDIDLLLLDKTGTITIGNRMAVAFLPAEGSSEKELAEVAQLASLSDETPEGRSIVVLAKTLYGMKAESVDPASCKFVPFSAAVRMSGVDLLDTSKNVVRSIRKGAVDSIKGHIEQSGGIYPNHIDASIQMISKTGGTPLLVCDGQKILGVIHLKDVIKGGIRERFEAMRKMGIKTVMITGDNHLTAAAIAAEAGVDDFIAEATPEIKLNFIKSQQQSGCLVAMTGDGTNDAPALAQADVAVAMNTGTQASRDAGNMVDLDSNPTKLLDIVEIGKQLLMTRGALTTFSIANDVAKYFAIIPAIFGSLYADEKGIGPLSRLNIMYLQSSESAILSAIIFNALIIIALIPLALRGVYYTAKSADKLLRDNLLIYGLGGLVAPFIGLKAIDILISRLL